MYDDTVMTEEEVVVVVIVAVDDDEDDNDDDDVHSFEQHAIFDKKFAKKCQARRHLANEITKHDEQNHIANVCPMSL